MAEIWELVDENKNKTGVLHERGKETSIPKGMYHLVVDIWCKTRNNEILLTQRHHNKNYGLLWECTGGSVVAGEDSIDGAVRELAEEIGIYADKSNMIYLGDTKKSNYIIDTYLYILNDDNPNLILQKEEVVDAKFVSINNMDNYIDVIVDGVWERFCQFKEKIINIT